MRKRITLLIVGILLFSGINAIAFSKETNQNVSIESDHITFSEPIIVEKNNYVELVLEESNSQLLRDGKPIIPVINKEFTFPFGTKIKDVQVTFEDTYQRIIPKLIKKTPQVKYISTEYQDEDIDTSVDYSKINIFPEKRFNYRVGSGLVNGEHVIIVNVQIYPVQYKPQIHTIEVASSAEITVKHDSPEEPLLCADEYDFLILSPSEFSDELQPLVDYKNNNGVSTILKTLDDIPDVGSDEPESIKYFIKNAIEEWGIDYVLLVGSWVQHDNDEPISEYAKFPIRKAYIPSGNYETWFPSDLYYADIYDANGSFSTWDADGDGKYAEITSFSSDAEAMDLYPDVALGRLPCISEAEVTEMVDKIILYQEHNKMTNKIVQIGGDTFPGDPEEVNEGEFANSEVITHLPGYESIRLWASESDGADKLSKFNIAQGFNGNVDFVDFSGHGSSASWATHAPQDDHTWLPAKTLFSPYTGWLYIDYDLFFVNNQQKHPVVVFNACSCSKYSESQQCMSWASIRGSSGGIASFGASGIGYGSYGTSETERVWGWMEVHIFKGIYEDKILGDVWMNCLNQYTSNFMTEEPGESDYKTVVEMSMFGDPTLAIEDGKNPESLDVKPSLREWLFSFVLEKLANEKNNDFFQFFE